MLSQSIKYLSVRSLVVVVSSAFLLDCSSDTNNPGTSGTGGSTATGGAAASGGATYTGGAKSTGGSSAVGGATSASGGASTTGGATATTGGVTATPSGGATAQGGSTAAVGGITGIGGASATGGGSSTAGAPGEDAGSQDGGERVTFTMVYTDIISARCLGCHVPGGPGVTAGKLDMSTKDLAYANLVGSLGIGIAAAGSSCGTSGFLRVTPGDHETSLIWEKVDAKLAGTAAPCGNPMPAGSTNGPLTSAQVGAIANWIDSGAAND